jgi:hypothetical protein
LKLTNSKYLFHFALSTNCSIQTGASGVTEEINREAGLTTTDLSTAEEAVVNEEKPWE